MLSEFTEIRWFLLSPLILRIGLYPAVSDTYKMSPLILRVGLSPAVRRIKAGWIVIKFYYVCAGSCVEVLKRLTCLTCNIKLRFRHTLKSILFNRVTVDVAFITIQYLITYLPIYFVWKTSNIYEYNNTGSGFTKPRSEIKFCLLAGIIFVIENAKIFFSHMTVTALNSEECCLAIKSKIYI